MNFKIRSSRARACSFLAISLLVLGAAFGQGAAAVNLLPNGGFERAAADVKAPEGWSFMVSDNQTAAVPAGERPMHTETHAGNTVLKVVRPELVGATIGETQVTIPEGVKRVRVSFRYKSDLLTLGAPEHNGNGAGIYAYLDKARGVTEDHICVRWVGGMITTPWQEWSRVEREFDVPATHRELRLHLIFLGATGTFYFDDVEVVPVG